MALRIGLVTACYRPVTNGVTRMVALYRKYLEAAGHETTVFTLGPPDPAGDEPRVVRSAGLPIGNTGYYFNIRFSSQAQRLMRQMDILHCHHLLMSVELAYRYGRSPIVLTNHTRYDLYAGAYTPLPQTAANALMRRVWPALTDLCDAVVAPSESARQIMTWFGVRQPIEVIENGVDLELFHRPNRPQNRNGLGIPECAVLAVYVGRLSAEKNLHGLLKQFSLARQIAPNLCLLVVGSGPLANDLPKYTERLGVSRSVHFTGKVEYRQVPAYLAAGDFFVTASLSEVHPLSVIEAMATGLPVVAVSSPGIKDIVEDGVTGLLADDPGDTLAEKMAALAFDPLRRQKMGKRAIRRSERYDIKRTVNRTLELYQRLLEERPDLKHQLH